MTDTKHSRDDILRRLRAGVGRNAANAEAARAAIDAALAAPTAGPIPRVDAGRDALLERFRRKSLAYSSTVDTISGRSAAPAAIAAYLDRMGLPKTLVAQPALADLDWAAAGLQVALRGAEDADLVGVTGCFCAIAETGTLMMCTTPDTPAAVSLLPETHIAIVDAERVVAHMEQAWNLLRAEFDVMPRAVNFVSGPSRTGDIEQTIVLGAHGPYRVHILITV